MLTAIKKNTHTSLQRVMWGLLGIGKDVDLTAS